jgi:hypothetical protein
MYWGSCLVFVSDDVQGEQDWSTMVILLLCYNSLVITSINDLEYWIDLGLQYSTTILMCVCRDNHNMFFFLVLLFYDMFLLVIK